MKPDTILAKATHTSPAPKGYKGEIIITAQAYLLGGNQHPHFNVTGEISTASERARGDAQICGCIHDEAAKAWPEVAPIIALHLSNADDGEPMHAEANGFYWLAGVVPLGEKYNGGDGKTSDECLAILADHLRIDRVTARKLAQECFVAHARSGTAKAVFAAFVDAQRPRWQAEAVAGLSLIRSLSTQPEAAAA